MKKIIFMFALILGVAVSASAQTALVDNGTAKDNWYVGGGIGTNVWNNGNSWTLFNTKSNVNDGKTNSWWRTQPLHANLTIGKMFNPYLGAEVDYEAAFNFRGEPMFLDAHNLTGNVVVNLTNVIARYHGARRTIEVEVIGGLGWMHNFNDGKAIDTDALSVRSALRGNINLSKSFAITITPEYIWLPKNVGSSEITKEGVNLSVGVKYRFSSKRGNFPLRKLYDYAEVESLNATIQSLQATNENLAKANAELAETVKSLVAKGEKVVIQTKSVGTVFFEQGKSNVNQSEIAKIVDALKDGSGTIMLTGATSPEGSEKFNKSLGLSRAESVKDALISSGIDANRIVVKNDYDNQRSVIITVD